MLWRPWRLASKISSEWMIFCVACSVFTRTWAMLHAHACLHANSWPNEGSRLVNKCQHRNWIWYIMVGCLMHPAGTSSASDPETNFLSFFALDVFWWPRRLVSQRSSESMIFCVACSFFCKLPRCTGMENELVRQPMHACWCLGDFWPNERSNLLNELMLV